MMTMLLAVGCEACTPGAWGSRTAERNVTIMLVGATVGPSKADGSFWDCCGNVSPKQAEELIQILDVATGPTAELVAHFGSYVLKEASKPDPYGQADFFAGGRSIGSLPLSRQNDTFQVTWQASMMHVDWTSGPRVKITLYDSDDVLRDHDTTPDLIGTVWIETSDLESALADGKVHNISAAKQTDRQILFVALSVTPEGWTYGTTTSADDSISGRCEKLVMHVITVAQAENVLPETQKYQAFAQSQKCVAVPPTETQFGCALAASSVADIVACGYRMDMLDAIQAGGR